MIILLGLTANAQTYKIVITYDNSGNRIKREQICIDCLIPFNNQAIGNTSDSLLGTDELIIQNEDNIKYEAILFPNPTDHLTTLELNEDWVREQPTLYINDINGRVLFSTIIVSTKTLLDLEQFGNGVYFVQIVSSRHKKSLKLVKKS